MINHLKINSLKEKDQLFLSFFRLESLPTFRWGDTLFFCSFFSVVASVLISENSHVTFEKLLLSAHCDSFLYFTTQNPAYTRLWQLQTLAVLCLLTSAVMRQVPLPFLLIFFLLFSCFVESGKKMHTYYITYCCCWLLSVTAGGKGTSARLIVRETTFEPLS